MRTFPTFAHRLTHFDIKGGPARAAIKILLAAASLAAACGSAAQTVDPRIVVVRAVSDSSSVLESDTLQDVTVTSAGVARRLGARQAGAELIDIKEIAALPVLFGERDIMKSIQLLPGVKAESEGGTGYQVRGGTSAQNLVTVDNAVVYNSGHLMGLFSAFNDEALAGSTLFKGIVPARLGGGVSSVFEIGTRQGDMYEHHMSAGIGLLAAKVMAEGPIKEGAASYLVAARKSYLGVFLKMSDDFRDNSLGFYDVNAKLAWRVGECDNVAVSLLRSADNMDLLNSLSMDWGNTAIAARWFHTFSPRLFLGVTANASKYSSDAEMKISSDAYSLGGFVEHASLAAAFSLIGGVRHRLTFGAQGVLTRLRSAEWDIGAMHEREQRDAAQFEAWVADDWQMTSSLRLEYGLRLTTFTALGGAPYYDVDADGEIARTYNPARWTAFKTRADLEPRLNMCYALSPRATLRGGYSRTTQSIHAIRNSTSTSMPIDRYTMTSNIVRPMRANQVSLGWQFATESRAFDFSADAYYKLVDNVYDYADGDTWMTWIQMERIIRGGRGRAYGVELCAHKNAGPLTGWLAYTLSWAENKIGGINDGDWYTASNDRRHDISAVATLRLNERWTLSAAWQFSSGQALTAPSAKYDLMGKTYYYYAERNGYRAPAAHHLDLGATSEKRLSDRLRRTLTIGIYNLYSRRNPYMIYFSNDDDSPTGTTCNKISIFGFVPSVSYSIKF